MWYLDRAGVCCRCLSVYWGQSKGSRHAGVQGCHMPGVVSPSPARRSRGMGQLLSMHPTHHPLWRHRHHMLPPPRVCCILASLRAVIYDCCTSELGTSQASPCSIILSHSLTLPPQSWLHLSPAWVVTLRHSTSELVNFQPPPVVFYSVIALSWGHHTWAEGQVGAGLVLGAGARAGLARGVLGGCRAVAQALAVLTGPWARAVRGTRGGTGAPRPPGAP